MVLHKRPWCRGQMIDGRSIDRVEEVVWCGVALGPVRQIVILCCLDLYVITHSCSTIHFRSSHSDLHTMSLDTEKETTLQTICLRGVTCAAD